MKILVGDILKIAPVLKEVPWGVPLSSEDFLNLVHRKLELNELEIQPFPVFTKSRKGLEFCADYHASRIAYFVLTGWDDPIHIDVGVPGVTDAVWPISDGNHRLYAACIREDKEIEAELQGSVALLEECFGEGCCPD